MADCTVSTWLYTCLSLCLSSPLYFFFFTCVFFPYPLCVICVSVCVFCVNGAVSNRGRHDRVGKARERARGKGATCQAHPAGTRGPGAGHRTQQIWTLLRSLFRFPPPLARALHGTAQPGTAQNAPKQSGDCIGLIQQHPLTPWRDFLRINPPLNLSTAPFPPDCVHCGIAAMWGFFPSCWSLVWFWRTKMVCTLWRVDWWMKCS